MLSCEEFTSRKVERPYLLQNFVRWMPDSQYAWNGNGSHAKVTNFPFKTDEYLPIGSNISTTCCNSTSQFRATWTNYLLEARKRCRPGLIRARCSTKYKLVAENCTGLFVF